MDHQESSYNSPYLSTVGPNTSPSKYQSSHMHDTGSVFSLDDKPNEDWTKVSDLAERRRIQNRKAQRKYRERLKHRLEAAASSSASSEQSHAEPKQPKSMTKSQLARSTHSKQSSKTNNHFSAPGGDIGIQSAYYGSSQEDCNMFGQQSTQQLLTLPSPVVYHSYLSYCNSNDQFNSSSQPAYPSHPY